AEHGYVLHEQNVRRDLRYPTARETHREDPAFERQGAQRLVEDVSADRVEDEVHTTPVGECPDLLPESGRGQRDLGAARQGDRTLLLGAGAGDHPGTELTAELDRRQADRTRRAMHQ